MWRSICSSVDDFVRDAVAVVLRVSPCCASVGVAAKVDLDLLGRILRSARVASRSARAARIARRALSIRRTCTRLFVFSRRWNLRPAGRPLLFSQMRDTTKRCTTAALRERISRTKQARKPINTLLGARSGNVQSVDSSVALISNSLA